MAKRTKKKESSSKDLTRDLRKFSLNLPQTYWGGLAENWLMKEIGDMHWFTIFNSLGVPSGQLVDSNGERLYASFVRIRWESDKDLLSYTENQELVLNSQLSRYGSKMFFSEIDGQCVGKEMKGSLFTVFSSRKAGDNTTLKKGAPLVKETLDIPTHEKLPHFGKEYLTTKTKLSTADEDLSGINIELAGVSFPLDSEIRYSTDYIIEPVDDVNGVGLLYFASYPKICDKCERAYVNNANLKKGITQDWGQYSSCVARDILYLGNANPNQEIIYSLEDCKEVGDDKIQIVTSLRRKEDNQLIGKIFTIKQYHHPHLADVLLHIDENVEATTNHVAIPPKEGKSVDEPKVSANTENEGLKLNRKEIAFTIIDFLKELLEEDHIDESTDLKQLGIESVVYMELSEHLFDTHQILSNPSRFYGLFTINEIIDYLEGQPENKEFIAETQEEDIEKASGDIAIVGYSFRFPGASTPSELWELLSAGDSAVNDIPSKRWSWPEWVDVNKTHRGINKGGCVEGIEEFDAAFFKISPVEAELMDPQQRMLLQLTWKLIEHAGYKPSDLKGSNTGVYIGASGSDYELLLREHNNQDILTGTGTALALLPNRLSYFFDFDGPSLQIDTACSSSLVAIHEAVKALNSGEISQAVVGGVHVMCHPSRSLSYYQSNMLSKDGKCQTFDHKANGYVRGEGAAVTLLKPLDQAIKDGDHIHGVIKGSAVNHGGQSGGLTVPNPEKQSQLLQAAYANAGVDITTVNYMEAHGTGTGLGDPIEVHGLSTAFNRLNPSTNNAEAWCGLGSIKTNIGHLEAAAGMAGLIKLLVCMEKKQLVKTNNFQQLNPKVELKNSPFRIQEKNEQWKPVKGQDVLRAGVSSFGIGGANGHVVLESFENNRLEESYDGSYVFVLSAKNDARLKEYAALVQAYVNQTPQLSPASVSYASQVAREEMEQRLAVVFQNLEELTQGISAFLEDAQSDNLFSGNIKSTNVSDNVHGNTPEVLAKQWINGAKIDWTTQYKSLPSKAILPTYPFAKDQFWLPQLSEPIDNQSVQLHPLLHENSSDLKEQRFTSTYSGKELFFQDHEIVKEKVFPGVAYLELAKVAGEKSTGSKMLRIKDVTWLSPIKATGGPVKLNISLYDAGDHIEYDIYSGKDKTIHGQGRLSDAPIGEAKPRDLVSLKTRLLSTIDKKTCYNLLKNNGLNYGRSFQGIDSFHFGAKEALSKISLPKQTDYTLQPGMLDSALQSCLLIGLANGHQQVGLPYSMSEVLIYKELPNVFWCHASKNTAVNSKAGLVSYNIDLLGESGEVLIQIRDFTTLPVEGLGAKTKVSPADQLHLYKTSWQQSEPQTIDRSAKQIILLAGGSQTLARKITDNTGYDVSLLDKGDEVKTFSSVFSQVRTSYKSKGAVNITLVCKNEDYWKYGFISGLFKTAQLENPKLTGKVIGVDNLAVKSLESLLVNLDLEKDTTDEEVRYSESGREVKQQVSFNELDIDDTEIRPGGTYIITGGTGGLGKIFANHISKLAAVNIVLVGRSKLTSDRRTAVEAIKGASYFICDVTDQKQVAQLIKDVKSEYGEINGIIHAAGIIKDGFIIKKTAAQFKKVLTTKIEGLKNLDETTKKEPLDFLILFSSISARKGNLGQSDYAAANNWLDGYAEQRNLLKEKGTRSGKTLSINWPLWSEGGMTVDEDSESRLEAQWGTKMLPITEGVRAFDTVLKANATNVLVTYGNKQLIEAKLLHNQTIIDQPNERVGSPATSVPNVDQKEIKKATVQYLTGLMSDVLKLPEEKFELDIPFEEYGIDSILINKLTKELDDAFEDLSRTLFFEYQTLGELVDYFVQDHQETILLLTSATTNEGIKHDAKDIPGRQARVRTRSRISYEALEKQEEQIVIVGLSGKYPDAANIDEFWENLKLGKDSVTEIPKDRWDLKDFFDTDKGKSGRSYSKWGGFINGIDKFDPTFFNISPREAELMDPQERLFLQAAWESVEDAGYTRSMLQEAGKQRNRRNALGGKVGVFAGVMYEEYQIIGAEETMRGNPTAIWSNPSGIANRVSYFLNLHGPSMAVDTMCSSSLTAIHLACESIKNGDCEYALAGGVNVSVHPNKYLMLSQGRFVSANGRCESFGKGGEGYVPGEGVGVVFLKTLSKAKADGDQIYGIIRGTSLNHGGKTNGYTVPNPNAQAEVVTHALERAGVKPEEFSYLEAHGTGTSLGDPIEITGLNKAFDADKKQYCAIGSVKSNIGHAESAAGISGLSKVLLQMKHKQLVPSLHSEVLNPNIDFAKSPFKVQQTLTDWKKPILDGIELPRIAGVSSFGAGGSNAHIIIEEYDEVTRQQDESDALLAIPLSARNENQLNIYVEKLLNFLDRNQSVPLADVAYMFQTGREAMKQRLIVLAKNTKELEERLNAYLENKEGVEGIYQGNIKNKKQTLIQYHDEEELQELMLKWTRSGAWSLLAPIWVNGIDINWQLFYGDNKRQRISLPTYPFAQKSYWITKWPEPIPVEPKKPANNLSINISLSATSDEKSTKAIDQNRTILKTEKISLPDLTASKSEVKPASNQPLKISLDGLEETPPSSLSATFNKVEDEKSIENAVPDTPKFDVEAIKLTLVEELSKALFLETSEIENEDKFVDLGLDSVVGVEWIQTINRRYNLNVPATKLYDYPTVDDLAGFIVNEMGQQSPSEIEITTLDNVVADLETAESIVEKVEVSKRSISNTYALVECKETLKDLLADALYLEASEIDEDDKFIDLGLDSVVGVEWIRAINDQYGLNLPATKLYDFPTVSELADHIVAVGEETDQQVNETANNITPKPEDTRKTNPIPEQSEEDQLRALLDKVANGDLSTDEANNLLMDL